SRTEPRAGARRGNAAGRNRAWWLAASLLTLAVAGLGCSPITTLSFLMQGMSPNNIEPACPLTLPGKEAKVVIICAHEDSTAVALELRDADQALARLLAAMLAQRYKENGDKVKIVPVSKVDAYLRDHATWVTQSKQELGKHFDADFLVFLELGPMTMYEPGSRGSL